MENDGRQKTEDRTWMTEDLAEQPSLSGFLSHGSPYGKSPV